jgi:(p)ppGpp synthase/HD superfamily hydrolase
MGMINDITMITTKVGVNIRRFNIGTEDGIFDGFIDLYVNDMDYLEDLIEKLRKIDGIESVGRKDL